MDLTRYRLGDIATVDISGVDKKTTPGEKSVRLCNYVDVYHNYAITKDFISSFMIASANSVELDTFSLRKGDVAITKDSETRDDLGASTYIVEDFDEDVVLGYHTALIRPDNEVLDSSYLNALLNTTLYKTYWFNNASGSGQRYTLSQDVIEDLPLFLPDIKVQRRVGEYFSLLEKRAALCRRENKVLKDRIKQLYDYWFVQFDFPNADGKPYKSNGGKMEWNETLKRDIPAGWDFKSLSSYLQFNQSGEWGEDSLPHGIEVHCVRGADIIEMIGAPIRYIAPNKSDKLLASSDIIVEISGGSPTQATGRSNYVTKTLLSYYNDAMTCSNFCQVLRLKNRDIAPYFFMSWQLLYDNGNMFHYEGKTSGLKNLQIDTLLSESWYFPPSELIKSFASFFNEAQAKINNNLILIHELEQLRAFLIPLATTCQATIAN